MPDCYLKPRPGKCIVEREGFKYEGRLVIPEKAKQLPTIGRIIAVGDPDHEFMLGQRIIWARYSGVPISITGKPKYDVFAYEEILCEVCTDDEVHLELEDTSLMTRD